MRVVIAIDRTSVAEQAVAAVCKLGSPADTELLLVNVLNPGQVHETVAPEFSHSMTPEAAAGGQLISSHEPAQRVVEDRGQALHRAHEEMCQYLEQLHARYLPAIKGEYLVVDSPHTAAALIAAAREYRADIIIVGTHGRTGVGRAVFGSVAQEVIRQSPVPVLVVGPAAGARAA